MIGVLYLEYVRVTDTNHLAVSTGMFYYSTAVHTVVNVWTVKSSVHV